MVFVFSVFKPCFIRGPVLMYHRARSCRIMPPFAFHCIVALLEGTPFAFIASLQTLHATNATMQRNDFPRTSPLPLCQPRDTAGKVLFGNFSISLYLS